MITPPAEPPDERTMAFPSSHSPYSTPYTDTYNLHDSFYHGDYNDAPSLPVAELRGHDGPIHVVRFTGESCARVCYYCDSALLFNCVATNHDD